jgi:hypothetical protein
VAPIVNAQIFAGNGAVFVAMNSAPSTTQFPGFYVQASTSQASASGTIYKLAIGRWV